MIDEDEQREIDQELQAKFDEIMLMEEGKSFLTSKLGIYLRDCALMDEEQAWKQWVDMDPTDSEAIMKLQFKAKVPNLVFSWIFDALRRGREAEELLEQEHNDA